MTKADELRETAEKLDKIANVSTPWIHAKLTPMLREAADIIDEFAKLTFEQKDFQTETANRYIHAFGAWLDSDAENAKLRKLVEDMHEALFSLNLDHCQACPREDACLFVHKSFDCDECAFERDMREMGIGVTDG